MPAVDTARPDPQLLTHGNAAKIFCLDFLDRLIRQRGGRLSLLDLGCGAGANFRALLERHPEVTYTGVEPAAGAVEAARQHLAGLNATLVHAAAYDFDRGPFDVVLSFSVLEHVYRRAAYLACARRNLAAGGLLLINYDAGHFVNPTWRDRAKNIVGPILARAGIERYYQAFVKEDEFMRLAVDAGFEIDDACAFNTALKGLARHVPTAAVPTFNDQWLAFEARLREMLPAYTDEQASVFRTRNFVLIAR